jgi:hypothetical protein
MGFTGGAGRATVPAPACSAAEGPVRTEAQTMIALTGGVAVAAWSRAQGGRSPWLVLCLPAVLTRGRDCASALAHGLLIASRIFASAGPPVTMRSPTGTAR